MAAAAIRMLSAASMALIGGKATGLSMTCAKVTDLYRYPVKGLSGDALERVLIRQSGETFPDDRRYALLERSHEDKWNGDQPEWLHKENFLCAFTEPALLSQFQSSYAIKSSAPEISRGLPCDAASTDTGQQSSSSSTERLLSIAERSSGRPLLGPVDLAQASGRDELARFLCQQSGRDVTCVTAESSAHTHQYGNTSSGWKQRRDTRTVHIVNRATIEAFSEKIGVALNPYRFRPNIVLEGVPAWAEFDWVTTNRDKYLVEPKSGLKLTVINRTVRCKGVSVDPTDPANHVLDIPRLLAEHFAEHGPFFGVYAVVDNPGSIAIGDELRLEMSP